MKLTVKCILDVSMIKQDTAVAKELLAEKEPLRVALVRNQTVLVSEAVAIPNQASLAQLVVNISIDYPCDEVPGLYLTIGKNLAEDIFLNVEPMKIWVGPERFKKGVADLSREKIGLPLHVIRRWLLLCREYTITGRVVKRVQRWDPIEQMYVPCDEPVPGAKVEAFDVDCWWFWFKRDLAGTAVTNPDGTFEISFRWCCLLWLPFPRRRWVIDPDLLKQITEAVRPHVGPIPPEILKSPVEFERFLGVSPRGGAGGIASRASEVHVSTTCAKRAVGEPRAASFGKTVSPLSRELAVKPLETGSLVEKIRPLLPRLPCWPFRARDCTPDIVFRVTQECDEEIRVIYDEGPFQARWNIPTNLNVTLLADESSCSLPVCEEPPVGDCLKFMWVNCIGVEDIGTAAGSPDLRGYANPGDSDNPFAGEISIKGRFGAGSTVDYFKVEYAHDAGPFQDLPEEALRSFDRRYWAPPPGSPLGTLATWNKVVFKPDVIDGKVVYKTLRKAEQENPLPAGWPWGYLWNDAITLFRWNSAGLDGDGLYTLRLTGYRWDAGAGKLVDAQIMRTCDITTAPEEKVMVRVDNREKDDPVYRVNEDRPCGSGTIHLCTYEPDCDFRQVVLVRKGEDDMVIGPCDIVELTDNDYIVIHFTAKVPANTQDGHLLAYRMYAHWGEDLMFNAVNAGDPSITLEPDSDLLVGPTYGDTLAGPQMTHRLGLAPTDPEHDRPYWFGGNFKTTIKGSKFTTCAYTLSLRVWKRTIEGCTDPAHVHVNWCSYSFTIKKV